MSMRMTQGAFSYLPDLTDEQIELQLEYCIRNGWSVGIEYTDDPHPRNAYWEMWDLPMFDLLDPSGAMTALQACRKAFPDHYIRVVANNSAKGRESVALSFIVNRPATEPGFRLERQEASGRAIRYSIHSYAADQARETKW